MDNLSTFGEKLFRHEDASTAENRSYGGHIALGAREPDFGQPKLSGSNQSPSQKLTRETATAGTWPDTVADIPTLAAQGVRQRVPQVGYADDCTITDQPISRMWDEPARETLASRTRRQAGQKRREIVIWEGQGKWNQEFTRVSEFTDEIAV